MLKITLKDWTGLLLSETEMTESELGYNGDIDRLQKMARNIATSKTVSVLIEQDNKKLVSASYVEGLL